MKTWLGSVIRFEDATVTKNVFPTLEKMSEPELPFIGAPIIEEIKEGHFKIWRCCLGDSFESSTQGPVGIVKLDKQ